MNNESLFLFLCEILVETIDIIDRTFLVCETRSCKLKPLQLPHLHERGLLISGLLIIEFRDIEDFIESPFPVQFRCNWNETGWKQWTQWTVFALQKGFCGRYMSSPQI